MTPITHMQSALFLTRRGARRCAEQLAPDPLVGMVAISRLARFTWQVAWTVTVPEVDS